MRCLGCQYDLSNLSEHRCPECGRAFDPNDPSTFEVRRSWMRLRFLCIAIIGMATWCYLSITNFVDHLVPPHEIPFFYQFASEAVDAFVVSLGIVALLLIGFFLGAWRARY